MVGRLVAKPLNSFGGRGQGSMQALVCTGGCRLSSRWARWALGASLQIHSPAVLEVHLWRIGVRDG